LGEGGEPLMHYVANGMVVPGCGSNRAYGTLTSALRKGMRAKEGA
jgi:hypothetical protein